MKVLEFLYLIVIVAFVVSCSSDDDNNSNTYNSIINKITVGDSGFEMNTAIVEPTLNNQVFFKLD
ncbi:MAG: hypothetical protein CMC55_05475 [Flavobacteriaceae bacterium]|uniref:hypothetical protein n=1 Tax=Bizionia echini TaxID=649333 RepID=UPI000C935094|nr:hypothetical protein [Flavobacteriaceae bacterium]